MCLSTHIYVPSSHQTPPAKQKFKDKNYKEVQDCHRWAVNQTQGPLISKPWTMHRSYTHEVDPYCEQWSWDPCLPLRPCFILFFPVLIALKALRQFSTWKENLRNVCLTFFILADFSVCEDCPAQFALSVPHHWGISSNCNSLSFSKSHTQCSCITLSQCSTLIFVPHVITWMHLIARFTCSLPDPSTWIEGAGEPWHHQICLLLGPVPVTWPGTGQVIHTYLWNAHRNELFTTVISDYDSWFLLNKY